MIQVAPAAHTSSDVVWTGRPKLRAPTSRVSYYFSRTIIFISNLFLNNFVLWDRLLQRKTNNSWNLIIKYKKKLSYILTTSVSSDSDMKCWSECPGCGCSHSEFGCCSDRRTPAQGPYEEGCGCEASHYGCCPDGVTPSQGELFQGCMEDSPIVPGGELLHNVFQTSAVHLSTLTVNLNSS